MTWGMSQLHNENIWINLYLHKAEPERIGYKPAALADLFVAQQND